MKKIFMSAFLVMFSMVAFGEDIRIEKLKIIRALKVETTVGDCEVIRSVLEKDKDYHLAHGLVVTFRKPDQQLYRIHLSGIVTINETGDGKAVLTSSVGYSIEGRPSTVNDVRIVYKKNTYGRDEVLSVESIITRGGLSNRHDPESMRVVPELSFSCGNLRSNY